MLLFIISIVSILYLPGLTSFELLQSWKNTPFYGFQGIRYAEPPIGQLRFKVNIFKINLIKLCTEINYLIVIF